LHKPPNYSVIICLKLVTSTWRKTFKGKRPCTICRITPKGQQAFESYVKALKSYLKVAKK
jgi:hypothetical protein